MNGMRARSAFAEAGRSVLVALALLVAAFASAQTHAEATAASGKTLDVGVDEFVGAFNDGMIRLGLKPRVDGSYLKDTGGVNIGLNGPLGTHAELIAGISRKDRKMATVLVMVENAPGAGGFESIAVVATAISAAIPGTTPESINDSVLELLKQGGGQTKIGKITVAVRNLGGAVAFVAEPA